MAARQFEVVPDDPPSAPAAEPKPSALNAAAVGVLLMSLKTISQRAYIALLDTFSLLTVASAFYLFLQFPAPTPYQIALATIYCAFVLAANFIVRRGK